LQRGIAHLAAQRTGEIVQVRVAQFDGGRPAILSATTAIGDVVDRPRASCQSAALYARYMPRTPIQRSGSGSQLRDRWPTHGSSVRAVR
jgi:hypothetical protein